MTKLIYIITIGFAAVLVNPLFGQDELHELNDIFEKYQQMEVISMDVEAFAFAGPSDQKGKKLMSGAVRIDHNNYYSKTNDMEMIVVDREMTLVRHKEKKILLARSKPIKELKKEQAIFNLRSFLDKGGDLSYLGQQAGNDVYQIKMQGTLVDKLELHVNGQGWVERLTYYYASIPNWESPHYKMDVHFSNISQKPPSKSYFDDSKFLSSRRSSKPSKALQGYDVEEVDYSTYQD